MVDIYSNSHEVDEAVIGSVHSGAFACTLDDALTCTSSCSGVVRDQSIVYMHKALKIISISKMT